MEKAEGKVAEVDQNLIFVAPAKEVDVEMTVKRSRFIGSVRIALDPDGASEMIKRFPEIFPRANHHCWAYRIGTENILERVLPPTGRISPPLGYHSEKTTRTQVMTRIKAN